jgi:hypoxanthine phosphoribosyltransferase
MSTTTHKKTFQTWVDINTMICNISEKIKKGNWDPDIIIGITRGGLIPAVILSNLLDTRMRTWKISLRDEGIIDPCPLNTEEIKNKKILIVDDLNDTGQTLATIQDILGEVPNIRYAALIENKSSLFKNIDYYSQEIDKSIDDSWIVFPWEKH